jgi:hypothetical protein
MITRHHLKGDAASIAEYSDCETYRYTLTRVWDGGGPRAAFVMLNPSTATEVQNDPTVERCEGGQGRWALARSVCSTSSPIGPPIRA